MEKNIKNDLSSQIKKAIGYRILFCFVLAISVILLFTVKEISNSSDHLKESVHAQCKNIESFIVDQSLVNNKDAIQPKIDSLNKNSDTQFFWDSSNKKTQEKEIHWHFPMLWTYSYPVESIDGTKLGTLIVKGNFLNNHEILSSFLIRIGFLLLFFIGIFIVLYPLSKRIPQQLFITPINNLLSLLREGRNNDEKKDLSDLPEELNEIHTKITSLLEDEKTRSKQTALGQLASQVAHDIRSPLLVLTRILNDLSSLPEKKRIDARHAIQRVTDIANNLLTQYKNKDTETMLSAEPVAMMLESIISEKRIQATDLKVNIELNTSQDAYNAFIQVDIAGFNRVISNLINNAIEAVKNKNGQITISVSKHNEKVSVSIKDNGCGIPKNNLQTVLEPGISYGKKEGSGLGLPYAVKKIAEWQGSYSLTSEPNIGTAFEIIFPEVKPAEWFGKIIRINEGGTIVVLDDDNYIHQIWDERFPQDFLEKNSLSLLHFNNPQDFILFCSGKNIENITFLLDYEIGQYEETGLSLATQFNIGKCASLVTSRYEDNDVRENCKALGMKIIPKYFAEHVPIFVTSKKSKSQTKVVFIDDDKTITAIWQESAMDSGINLTVFHNPNEFIRLIDHFPKETLIYIDSSLGENLKGEEFAQLFYEKGYTNIILATGYPKEHFQHVTWVKDIIEKNPPWE